MPELKVGYDERGCTLAGTGMDFEQILIHVSLHLLADLGPLLY
jgi:hypothetical protein